MDRFTLWVFSWIFFLYIYPLYCTFLSYSLMLSGSAQDHNRVPFNTSWSHENTFFISYWSRNIFITLSGVSGQAESLESRGEGERGHVEPDRDTCMTLWHVKIPSTELCLAQQHETRKWATNIFLTTPSSPQLLKGLQSYAEATHRSEQTGNSNFKTINMKLLSYKYQLDCVFILRDFKYCDKLVGNMISCFQLAWLFD